MNATFQNLALVLLYPGETVVMVILLHRIYINISDLLKVQTEINKLHHK